MSTSCIETIDVTFTCPLCGHRGTHQLMYVGNHRRGKKPNISTWCRCKGCKEVTDLKYLIRKTKKGLFRLNVLSCISKETQYPNKRYFVNNRSH